MAPNLEKLLVDLVDIGLTVKDVANKRILSALRRSLSLSSKLDGKRDWKACGEEFLSLQKGGELKKRVVSVLERKLLELNDKKVEAKILEGFSLLVEASDSVEGGVGVGKKISDFLKG